MDKIFLLERKIEVAEEQIGTLAKLINVLLIDIRELKSKRLSKEEKEEISKTIDRFTIVVTPTLAPTATPSGAKR